MKTQNVGPLMRHAWMVGRAVHCPPSGVGTGIKIAQPSCAGRGLPALPFPAHPWPDAVRWQLKNQFLAALVAFTLSGGLFSSGVRCPFARAPRAAEPAAGTNAAASPGSARPAPRVSTDTNLPRRRLPTNAFYGPPIRPPTAAAAEAKKLPTDLISLSFQKHAN